MGGDQSANPLGRNPFASRGRSISVSGSFGRANPVGIDADEPLELDTKTRITKVTKDWSDPPSVTLDFTPNLSASSLKAVLVQLQQYQQYVSSNGEWGRGGADILATPKYSKDGRTCTVELTGKFYVDLPKWTEYDTMTAPQKKAWDDMIALLTKHEREHAAIAYRGANELMRKLTNLDTALYDQTLANNQKKTQDNQDDFDSAAKTDHGRKDWGAFKTVELDTSADPPPPKTP
jgi:hypothetical protein